MMPFYKQSGNLFANVICTNCSEAGHTAKRCQSPTTSYGIILFRYNKEHNQSAVLHSDKTSTTGLEGANFEYLLIQRKDSISFIEVIRGKYSLTDYEYIKKTMAGMTAIERERILKESYDELWENLWGPCKDGINNYRHEKEQGRQKLDALRSGTPSLESILKECGTPFQTPEWGFPKGRKNVNETQQTCALRETWEETNIKPAQIVIINNMDPITEIFTGSNNIQYCHKYYIGYTVHGIGEETVEAASKTNEHIKREVGDIRWCSLDAALSLIRKENPEKRDVLLRVDKILKKFCPLQLGPLSLLDLSGGH
jgi:8-oxo-dGTP pyrophosphatase MutT (NUDIX family)